MTSKLVISKDLIERWAAFFQDPLYNYDAEITRLGDNYPEEKSLYVNYWDMEKYNDSFAEGFLAKPREHIPAAEQAIQELLPEDVGKPVINLRVMNIPETHRIRLPDLRTVHLEHYIAVEGIVVSRSEVRPRITSAIFRCLKCGFNMVMAQDGGPMQNPYTCANDNCKRDAGKGTAFELVKTNSDFVDLQILSVQEPPETLKGTAPPQRLRVFLRDDLCGKVLSGEHVIVNGIAFASQRKIERQLSTDFDIHMEAYSLEMEDNIYSDISISAEEKIQILELSKNPMIYDMFRDSIAPGIFEMEYVKEAIVLQLFGGVAKTRGVFIRGDIHILLVGDPGVAKSQLLEGTARIAPKAVSGSGKGISKAGLTATVERDEFDNRWTLIAGLLVLAHQGLAAIDEIDKMRSDDRAGMHEAMEQQHISINKGGINTILNAACSILAAANPKDGRFQKDKPYIEQIKLSTTLLSRFDLMFPIIDKPNEERDRRLGSKILDNHIAGQIHRNVHDSSTPEYEEADIDSVQEHPTVIPETLFQKYITYARKNVFPVMGKETKKHLLDCYVAQRKDGNLDFDDDVETVPTTPRQLEGLVRLSEASARVRLCQDITVADCDRAIKLYNRFLGDMARDSKGRIDIDTIETGKSAQKRNYEKIVLTSIRELDSDPDMDTNGGVKSSDLHTRMMENGIPQDQVENLLDALNFNGVIFRPGGKMDRYKIVGGK